MSSDKIFKREIESVFENFAEVKDLKQVKPNINSITKFLIKSHNFSKDTYSIYNGIQRQLYIGMLGGVTFDKYLMKIKYNGFKSYSDPSPYAGIRFDLLNQKTGNGFLFESTLNYKAHHYSYFTESENTEDYFESSVKGISINSRIGMIGSFLPSTFLKPFLEGGLITSYYLRPEYENLESLIRISDNTIFTFRNQDKLNSDFYYGLSLRSGIKMPVSKSNYFKLSGGYNYLMSSAKERIHSFDLSIIYMLKMN
jgi:hypothetical protein